MAPADRDRFFSVEFGFRRNLCERALTAQGVPTADQEQALHALDEDICEIELDFADPAFQYSMCWYGAVATT